MVIHPEPAISLPFQEAGPPVCGTIPSGGGHKSGGILPDLACPFPCPFSISSVPTGSCNHCQSLSPSDATAHTSLDAGHLEYEVAFIVDSRWHWNQLQYPIDWKGYCPKDMSWEDAMHAPHLVHQIHLQYPWKPSLQGSRRRAMPG